MQMRNRQFDLFNSNAAQSSKSTIGLEVKLSRACVCGKELAAVCPGQGSHCAELRCAKCGTHRMWLYDNVLSFLAEVCERFGRPTAPVVIRGEYEEL
jgi:hypothetical protein